LRRWSYEGETVLRMILLPIIGLPSAADFQRRKLSGKRVASWREMIREMYLKVINS